MPDDPDLDQLIRQEWTRRQVLRRMGLGTAVFALPGILAACGGEEGAQGGGSPARAVSDEEIEELRWALDLVRTLDSPAKSFDSGSQAASLLALEPLLSYDSDLQLVGVLAESWEATDAVTYVYQIRSGVTFWDGSPLTAEDVAFSISRHLDPDLASGLNSYMASVKSVRATGEAEVTVKLKQPDPFWQYIPTFTVVVPKQIAQREAKSFGAPGGPIMGTGPYVVEDYQADESVTYTRNEDYWGDKPVARSVSISVIADPQTRQLAMRSGEVDGTFDIPPADAADWQRLDGVTINSAPGLSVTFLSFDLAQAPWTDIHVRRAIAHALNREGLVDSLLGGFATPATSMVPRGQWSGLVSPDRVEEIYAGLATYEFSLEKAREELAQSSMPDGFSATLKSRDNRPDMVKAAVNLSQNLKQIGIDLRVQEQPLSQEIEEVVAHEDLGLRILNFAPDYPDPGNYPSFMFPSEFARPNGFNVANWKNDEVDRLLKAQAATIDQDERANAIAEIMELAADELPYLPVWWEDTVMAIHDEFVYQNLNPFYSRQAWTGNIQRAAD